MIGDSDGDSGNSKVEDAYMPLLRRYKLNSLDELHSILFDAEESTTYHRINYERPLSLSPEAKNLSSTRTYKEICEIYGQVQEKLNEGRSVLRYKYYSDDFVRAHQQHKTLWLLSSGALFKMRREKEFYRTLQNFQYPEYYSKVIEADVRRTLQEKSEQNQTKLRNILVGLARRNPFIGYCQGMNFLINFLIIMQFEEEECFWLARTLLEDIIPHNYYTNMVGVAVDLKIVEVFLKLRRNRLYKKLGELNISISIFALEWFVCLFTTVLPYCILTLLWDLIFLEGSIALLRACILIIDELEPFILRCNDINEFLSGLENAKKGLLLEQGRFVERMKMLFIDPRLLQVARLVYESMLVTQNTAANKKVPTVICSPKWPICHQLLQKNRVHQMESEVWVFKEEGGPRVIEGYLDAKRKSHKLFRQDNRDPQSRLMIGRQPHICNKATYELLRGKNVNIELNAYDSSTNSFELSESSYHLTETSLKFLRSATVMNSTFIFHEPRS